MPAWRPNSSARARRSTFCAAVAPCACCCPPPSRTRALPDVPRIGIAGDAAARERIAALLGDRVAVVPSANAAVVVIDLPSGRDFTAALDDGFAAGSVVLLDDPHADAVLEAVRAGASAVIARQSDAREMLAAIAAAGAGLIAVDPSAREAFGRRNVAPSGTIEPLTPRERDVLAMLGRGLSNKRIAARLNISEHTVKFHVGSILAKLGASTRAEAVALGARLGYVML